jgi:2-methylcitrate dehydratase PrpD
VAATIAFKPWANGTMVQPYVDCAVRLAARGVRAEDVAEITCETAEGILHRLWEPLDAKQAPPNAYAAKFSVPYGVAAGLLLGGAGLDAFTDARVAEPGLRALCARVGYVVDPANPYPRAYTGHVRVVLRDGSVMEERQANLRGGAADPLSRAEVEAKCLGNCRHGGWESARAEALVAYAARAFDAPRIDAVAWRG